MASKKKIKPPAPRLEGDGAYRRAVEVPPTVGARDTTAGDGLAKQKTRANFREEEFIRVIRQHGKHCVWRKALLCPCLNPETEQVTLDCPECNRDGYIYTQPQRIQALMFQFDKKTSIYEKFGLYQEGTVNVTVEPKYRLGYRDSLELLDQVIPFNELLIKDNRRGRRTALPAGVDSARFRIVSVAEVLYRTTAGELVSLEEGIHYTITPEGWIMWTGRGNRTVKTGDVFSIHYDFHPIYMVASWMHVTRDDISSRKSGGQDRVIAHPVQAMAKLDFLVNANLSIPALDERGEPSGFGPGGPGE